MVIGFTEIGSIIRLVLVYKLNIKKMNKAYKLNEDSELRNDIVTGIMFFVALILTAAISTYVGR